MSEYLNKSALSKLSQAWENWASIGKTYKQKVTRAKLYLLFLLFRYGGLRLAEALELSPKKAINIITGMIHIDGINKRDIFMPLSSMGALRRILSMPEAESPDFLMLDKAFIRKKFYMIGQSVNLSNNLVGPRGLRYSRGLELLEQHVPSALVFKFLGQNTSEQVRSFLKFVNESKNFIFDEQIYANKKQKEGNNIFSGVVSSVIHGLRKTRIDIITLSNIPLTIICDQRDTGYYDIISGQFLHVYIDPSSIHLCCESEKHTFINSISCEVINLHSDTVESFLSLLLENGEMINAEIETQILGKEKIQIGDKLFACFSAKSLKIIVEN